MMVPVLIRFEAWCATAISVPDDHNDPDDPFPASAVDWALNYGHGWEDFEVLHVLNVERDRNAT